MRKNEGNILSRCPLCLNDNEDLQHLLFKCSFSKDVWDKVRAIADIECDKRNWTDLVKCLGDSCVQKSIGWVIKRFALAACVYTIWQERNGRIFKDVQRTSQEVFNNIDDSIKHKLLGITVKNSVNVRNVEHQVQKADSKVNDGS
ncbi:hypothetical protein CTI12_AA506780 [Artemisia annua]|uniref:Reverse transcriptase zinc-binding domain-containing protein n=1 Tax=Artemisia annua TaxID=35608 RepID=A0A2U1L0D6_ARTAN|nr:hypothetical protein CTI12_AA506780 [Artemisia annua]